MATTTDLEKRVFAKIDELEDELVQVALDLGNVDVGLWTTDESGKKTRIRDVRQHEKAAAEYVFSWLERNGFEAKRQGAPDRFNVLGTYRGTGKGRSVIFNSHLDVGSRDGLEWFSRQPDAPFRTSAWREGDTLFGHGIINCKGPMACWLVSTKAIKDLGIELPGDVLMQAVVGETGGAPVDEYESPKWDSHELGARYAVSHGGIADYALVAETTGFTMVPMMTGFAYFKVTMLAGPYAYGAFFERPEPSMDASRNAIVRMCSFVERFEQYATEYQRKETYSFEGGTVRPNGIIGAIRAGIPAWPIMTPEVCSIYCDFRIAPEKNPLDIQRDLEVILADMGAEGTVGMYKYLRGQEGWRNKGFDTFTKALINAHEKVFDEPPKRVPTQFVSMWRDVNPYNEIGIPAISYGFATPGTQEGVASAGTSAGRARIMIADMMAATKVYASLTLDLCNRSANEAP